MKIMKIVLVVIALIGLNHDSFAATQAGQRIAARKCLRRTAVVIVHADKMVKQNKVYTGNLAKAIRHQRYARFLFRQGKFIRAIHQSRRARQLAFLAIQANKGTINNDWQLTKEENPGQAPSDEELEKELPVNTAGLNDDSKVSAADLKEIDVEDKD